MPGGGSTYHSQTLSVALWSETLACGTAWTSTVEELWAAPGRPGSKSRFPHGGWDGADALADLAGAPLMFCVAGRGA